MFSRAAHVYDAVYRLSGKDYDAEAAQLTEQVRQRAPGATSLLDVACGTGGHLVHLRRSFDVAGIDLDEGMLAQARSRLPGVDLRQADMRAFHLGRSFDAVVCLFSSVGYAADRAELGAAIGAMAGHVAPGGVLVVEGWIRPSAWIDPGIVDVVSGRDDDLAVARLIRSERHGDRTVLELHHLVGTQTEVEHLVDRHELTLFTDDDYRGAFRDAGLEAEVVDGPFADSRDRYLAVKAA